MAIFSRRRLRTKIYFSVISLLAITAEPALAGTKETKPRAISAKRAPSSQSTREERLKKNKEKFLSLLAGTICFQSANQLLKDWGASGEWEVRPGNFDGAKTFASPTHETGVWVEASIYPNHTVELSRQAPDSVVRANWGGEQCEPRVQPVPRSAPPAKGKNSFTDHDLEKIRQGRRAAVIFLWSPHMPLSVKALPELQSIAAKLDVDFVPVLDPDAAAGAVEPVAKEHHFDPKFLKRAYSIELSYRGAHLHYPSVLVVSAEGRISRLYPGYWASPEIIESFLRKNR